MTFEKIKIFLRGVTFPTFLILAFTFILFFVLSVFEHEKTLILLVTYIAPAFLLLLTRFRTRSIFLIIFLSVCLLQFIIYWLFQDRWAYGLFLEQDSGLLIKYFASVSINPIDNYIGGLSNGALYLSILKIVQAIIPLEITIISIMLNIFSLIVAMTILQKVINFRYSTNGIWAMKYLAISPLVHCYTFIVLKDILTMSLIAILLSVLIGSQARVKIIFLTLSIFFNRVLIGVASMAAGFPVLALVMVPVALYYLTNGDIFWIVKALTSAGEADKLLFPFSTFKFILTPLPHNATDFYPSQFPMIFHIPLSLAAIFGFIKYAKVSNYYFVVFIITYLLISHFSPGNVRYRLMFEPFLAIGFALFMNNVKITFNRN